MADVHCICRNTSDHFPILQKEKYQKLKLYHSVNIIGHNNAKFVTYYCLFIKIPRNKKPFVVKTIKGAKFWLHIMWALLTMTGGPIS